MVKRVSFFYKSCEVKMINIKNMRKGLAKIFEFILLIGLHPNLSERKLVNNKIKQR